MAGIFNGIKKMDEFGELRKKLDDAITYGQEKLARNFAYEGLNEAREKGLPGEMEYFKGQLEILDENYFEAIKHFDMAVKYNPKDGASFNDRALCMVELGIIDDSFVYFDKGIEVEPDYATVYHNKGWLLNKIGRYKEAIECFKKALELEGDRAVTYENFADALDNMGDYKAALSAYKKAISLLKPDYSDIKEQLVAQMKEVKKKIKWI